MSVEADRTAQSLQLRWLLPTLSVPGWVVVALPQGLSALGIAAFVIGGTFAMIPLAWWLSQLAARRRIEWSPEWVDRHWYWFAIGGPVALLMCLGVAFAASLPFR